MNTPHPNLPLLRAKAPRVRCKPSAGKQVRAPRPSPSRPSPTPTLSRLERGQTWRPPKPLVGQRALEKVLNRHTAFDCPESRLFVAVISVAIVDCLSLGKGVRREARRFLLGDDLGLWCDWVGLNPDFVRRIAHQAGYLADEQQHWEGGHAQVPTQNQTATPYPEGASE